VEDFLSSTWRNILGGQSVDRASKAKSAADWIATARRYRWVGLYEVTPADIGLIACSGSIPPTFPRFPVSCGLCGASVISKSVVNVGNVLEDPRWLTTFGTTRSEIIVPVFSQDLTVVGLIDVESDLHNAFALDDEHFLEQCATYLLPIFSKSSLR